MKYNRHLKCYVTPNEGQEYCKKCKGVGVNISFRKYAIRSPMNKKHTCNVCLGTGVLDWVEKATGKFKKRNKQLQNTGGFI